MIKTIKKYLMIASAAFIMGLPVLAPAVAVADCINNPTADISQGLKCGTCLDTNDPNCQGVSDQDATTRINTIIKLIINIFSLVVGVVSVIMIIIGGLKYITSGGDSGNVTSAKNTILYAIIGLVVVALAQFIVRFVLAKVSPS